MIRKLLLPLVFLAGTAVAAFLALRAGLPSVLAALGQIGWSGFALVAGVQAISLVLCAAAWRSVSEAASLGAYAAARWVRDSASNLVGFIPAFGEVVSARALTLLGGGTGQQSTASTVVDVAVETMTEALFAFTGIALLLGHLDPAQEKAWLGITVVGAIPLLALYLLSRNRKALTAGERLLSRIAGLLGFSSAFANGGLTPAIEALYGRSNRILFASLLHGAAWFGTAGQIWLAARGLSHPISLADSVVIASLVCAARSAFFLVPMAAGVQEGAFIVVGKLVGVDASTAVALSLVLRARDIVIGAPGMLFWYLTEGRRIWSPGVHA